jgi:hypothetical protein
MGAGQRMNFAQVAVDAGLDCEETATTRRERGWHEALVGAGLWSRLKMPRY